MTVALEPSWRVRLDRIAAAEGLLSSGATEPLGRAVAELSANYNAGRFRFRWTKELLAARLHFFLPRDVPKVDAAMRDLPFPARWKAGGELRILDYGAGLGASTLGAIRCLRRRGIAAPIVAELVDTDGEALQLAALILANEPEVRVVLRGGRPALDERFDLVILANAFVEMGGAADDPLKDPAGMGLLRGFVRDHLVSDGLLVVVEPALRPTARRLQRVRDLLVIAGEVAVVAPCPHDRPCPLLVDERDWCHDDVSVNLPGWLHPVAKAAGLRWQGLTFARLVLAPASRPRPGFRVVAPPRDTRGRRERQLCGDHADGSTLAWVDQLTRHDGPDGEAFAESERGDGLSIEPPAKRVGPGVRSVRFDADGK